MGTDNSQSAKTQCALILKYLQEGNKITPLDALVKFDCFRLGARIWDLRQAGHDIESERQTKAGKTYAVYSLKQKDDETTNQQ